jgi:hypothetical protein
VLLDVRHGARDAEDLARRARERRRLAEHLRTQRATHARAGAEPHTRERPTCAAGGVMWRLSEE